MIARIANVLFVLVLAALTGACSRQDDHIEIPTPLEVPFSGDLTDSLVVATVSYEGKVDTFLARDFSENLDRLNALFPEVMSDDARSQPIRQEIVRQYALERLLISEAKRRNLAADSTAIDAELAKYKARYESEDAFKAELEDIHQSEADLRAQFQVSIAREALLQSIRDSLEEPSQEKVAEYQKAMSTRLRVQHILISVPEEQTDADLAQSRKKTEALVDSLDSGKPFAMLARRHSNDPGSKVSGGELPWFRRGEMVPEFEVAAFSLQKQGEYTDHPVRTPYGYHLIRLLERRDDSVITADSARALLIKKSVRSAHEDLQRRLVEAALIRTNPAYIPTPDSASSQSD